MSNGFLSQEEIDALLNGGATPPAAEAEETGLSDIEKDLLGEVGNISMGSASTALSTIIGQPVNITTPVVTINKLAKIKEGFEVPYIALEVKYVSGIAGKNLLVMKIDDAAVIANLMMGGNGIIDGEHTELSELELSAVSEAMNQMIGSAATAMATMFSREVNISPPTSKVWADTSEPNDIADDESIVKVSFSLKIGDLVDSSIMQLISMETAKKIVAIMMGEDTPPPAAEPAPAPAPKPAPPKPAMPEMKAAEMAPPAKTAEVEVLHADFQPLSVTQGQTHAPKNIDLILDVPLEISVVLGKTKKSVKDILNLGTGSLVELDKLAEEPVEILVNGKKVAYGEVVVVDENFGVRITSIVSSTERIKSLGK
ncbi:MAG: flagellar motor switch phosphatase FliY [Solirubrobacterales bacterium]